MECPYLVSEHGAYIRLQHHGARGIPKSDGSPSQDENQSREALLSALRRLKHLRRTRYTGLDSGMMITDIVEEMDREIARIEIRLQSMAQDGEEEG